MKEPVAFARVNCHLFCASEAVLAGSGLQGMYKLLPGLLQPGAELHRQQAGLSGWMLLPRR